MACASRNIRHRSGLDRCGLHKPSDCRSEQLGKRCQKTQVEPGTAVLLSVSDRDVSLDIQRLDDRV